MVKVIETNLSIGNYDEILDHQSRVIEVVSWESFINEIKEAKSIARTAVIGSMYGNTLPKESKVENFIYDEFHLSCDFYNYRGHKSKKLAYLVKED